VFVPPVKDESLKNTVNEISLEKIKTAIVIPDKMRRQAALDEILRDVIEKLNTGDKDISKDIAGVFNDIEKIL